MGMLREDYFGTLQQLADTGCKYIEYVTTPEDENGVPVATPAEIGKRVKEMGLTPISSHVKFSSDPESMKQVIEDNLQMGTPRLVLPFELMNTEDEVKALAQTCNEMGRLCKENGLEFYYHNHYILNEMFRLLTSFLVSINGLSIIVFNVSISPFIAIFSKQNFEIE